ncbi:glutamine-hydrolyzing carbamoyl-phosphate synthase small subunit [candidate division CSSED10-310 bacterium]|uniref:Carbamoyl phosphate synthase small chain n=1 Tax=candidate division CSSED10-310 bacterium TaxID=2855610 RepID=A0ABV6Z140_UNCC1
MDSFLKAKLILEDGSVYEGFSFGYPQSVAGEVVFSTGMVGYPESLSDPSYCGQILALTYPLIGNYGVPKNMMRGNISQNFESKRVQISGLVVTNYSEEFYHWNAKQSLGMWLYQHNVPALTGIDTRTLTKNLREKGTMLGKIIVADSDINFFDPNQGNLVAEVSCKKPYLIKARNGARKYRVVLIDCGCKHNILRNLLKREVEVLQVPWNHDISAEQLDGLLISNGPGDPMQCQETITQVRKCIEEGIPIFGICLGHQILALAAGARTFKLKYGHRSQNQPVLQPGTDRCFVTSQNHGFAVDMDSVPKGWRTHYINLNDRTSEGLIHESGRFMSVQFHPEASPGPEDTAFLFDKFIAEMKK